MHRLGELCEFIGGVTFRRDDAKGSSRPGYLPVLRAGNIAGDHLNITDDLVWVPSEKVSKQQRLQLDDIVMCMSSGSPQVVGKSAQLHNQFPGSAGAFCCIIRPKPVADAKYLAYWFGSEDFWQWRDSQARGANIQNLRASQLKLVEIAIPPLPEQRRIAGILAKADRLRRLRRYALELSDTYLQSVFLEMFGDPVTNPMGWPLRKLGSIGTLDRGKSRHRPRNAPHLYGGPYPFVQTGDVANASGYILTYQQTYSEAGLAQSRLWPKGTLCITIAANIADTAVLTFDACFPDSVVGFHPGKETNVEFIQQWFLFLQWYLEVTAPEVAQKNINLKILREMDVALPPYASQCAFASIVRRHERLRAQQREALRQAEHLFQTLLHRAFEGEV